jgi:hypothetical protein
VAGLAFADFAPLALLRSRKVIGGSKFVEGVEAEITGVLWLFASLSAAEIAIAGMALPALTKIERADRKAVTRLFPN